MEISKIKQFKLHAKMENASGEGKKQQQENERDKFTLKFLSWFS